MRQDASYCALPRAIFWPLRGLNALLGHKTVTILIAFGSDIAYRSVGADAHIGPRSARRFDENLRQIRNCPNGPM